MNILLSAFVVIAIAEFCLLVWAHVSNTKQIKELKHSIAIESANTLAAETALINAEKNKRFLLQEAKTQALSAVAEARKDTLKKSRATLRGQATEHLAPIMTSEWSHKDFRFTGNPIDYLICSGASAIIDGEANTIDEVVLLEVKTGKSQLNKVQRRIRDAVQEGRVKFVLYNTDTNETREWKYETKQDDPGTTVCVCKEVIS